MRERATIICCSGSPSNFEGNNSVLAHWKSSDIELNFQGQLAAMSRRIFKTLSNNTKIMFLSKKVDG